MNCPNCGSPEVEQSGEFDLSCIDNETAIHDFECEDCLCLFTIEYHAVLTKIIEVYH